MDSACPFIFMFPVSKGLLLFFFDSFPPPSPLDLFTFQGTHPLLYPTLNNLWFGDAPPLKFGEKRRFCKRLHPHPRICQELLQILQTSPQSGALISQLIVRVSPRVLLDYPLLRMASQLISMARKEAPSMKVHVSWLVFLFCVGPFLSHWV